MIRFSSYFIIFTLGLFFQACNQPHATAREAESPSKPSPTREISDGYALLWDLVVRESELDKVLIVKDASPTVEQLLKDISRTFNDFKSDWDSALPSPDSFRPMEKILPETERRTRESIEGETTKNVLTASGAAFDLQMLLSQKKALEYASHLSRSLKRQETSPKRLEMIKIYHAKFEALGKRVGKLLEARAAETDSKK